MAANLALLLCSVAVSLALAELLLRATLYRGVGYQRVELASSSFKHTTTEFDTLIYINSLRMRDDEIGPKGDDEHRVLCLGDSFTFGVGVNLRDTWLKVAEQTLNRDGQGTFRFVNGGGSPAAPWAYDELVANAPTLDPDAVILQVFVGNDFYDLLTYRQSAAGNAVERQEDSGGQRPVSRARSRRRGLAQDIRLVDFLWNRLIGFHWADRLLFRLDLRYGNRGIYLRRHPRLEEELVQQELGSLGRIAAFCRERAVPLLVLIVPAKPQVFQAELLTSDRYDHRKPNRLISAFLEARRVPHLDLLDAFERLPEDELRGLYYVRDLHFTPAGHAFAAGEVTRRLRELGWFESPLPEQSRDR